MKRLITLIFFGISPAYAQQQPYDPNVAAFEKFNQEVNVATIGAERAVACSLRDESWARSIEGNEIGMAKYLFDQLWPIGDIQRETVGRIELTDTFSTLQDAEKFGRMSGVPSCMQIESGIGNLDGLALSPP